MCNILQNDYTYRHNNANSYVHFAITQETHLGQKNAFTEIYIIIEKTDLTR